MKIKYILLLVAGLLSSVCVNAQNQYFYGIGYNFNDDLYGALDENMGEVVFGADYSTKTVSLNVNEDIGFCILDIFAEGTLSVDGRYREVPSEIVKIWCLRYNSFDFGGTYLSDDNDEVPLLSYDVEEPYDDDGNLIGEHYYKVKDDVFRYYWIVWRAAKRLEEENPTVYQFERGSLITDEVDAQGFPISHEKYGNELFYYVKNVNGVKTYFPVIHCGLQGFDPSMLDDDFRGSFTSAAIADLENSEKFEFKFEVINSHKLYYSYEIAPEVFDFSDGGRYGEHASDSLKAMAPLSFSFGSSFTKLPSFNNCRVGNFVVDVQNANYIAICDGQVLCTKDKDGNPRTVVAVATGAGTINLPLTVDSIAPNVVTYGAQGLKLVSQNTSLKNAAGSGFATQADGEGSDVNSINIPLTGLNPNTDYITVPAAYIKSSKSSGSYGITQPTSTITVGAAQACVATLKENNAVCYIDLSNCTISDNKTFGTVDMSVVGPNCLLFLPEGIEATGNNVVTMKNGVRTCKNLTLVRENGKPFFSPYDFTAENVTISGYEIGENIVGLVLPFEYSNDNVKLATYTSASNSTLYFNNTITTIPANTPFVARKKDGVANQPLSATNVTIASTPTSVPDFPADGWLMNGTYLTVTNNGTACSIYGFSKNVLKKVEGATFKPFSAYFVCNNANAASEANVRFLISEADETTSVDSVLSLASVSAGNGVISVSASNTKIVVASINGAVLFDGVVNGTKTIDVQPGVYVVNGKKVVVNK